MGSLLLWFHIKMYVGDCVGCCRVCVRFVGMQILALREIGAACAALLARACDDVDQWSGEEGDDRTRVLSDVIPAAAIAEMRAMRTAARRALLSAGAIDAMDAIARERIEAASSIVCSSALRHVQQV